MRLQGTAKVKPFIEKNGGQTGKKKKPRRTGSLSLVKGAGKSASSSWGRRVKKQCTCKKVKEKHWDKGVGEVQRGPTWGGSSLKVEKNKILTFTKKSLGV